MGVVFEVVPTHVPELDNTTGASLTTRELVLANASRKASAAVWNHPGRVVLAADTEVSLDGNVFGKPANLKQSRAMLRQLSGRTHEVWTGVVVRGPGLLRAAAVCSWVTFHHLTQDKIESYLKKVNTLDKAGAYAVQEHPEMIIKTIEGSLSNVMGLPLELVSGWILKSKNVFTIS